MTTKYYEFYLPLKILSGENALENIPAELAALGASKPMIVTDKGVVKAGLVKTLTAALKASGMKPAAVFDAVPPDSSTETVDAAAVEYKKSGCDSLIAVGGGSAIDTAKGVNIAVSEGVRNIRDFAGVDRLTRSQKPLVAVPTTVGTGAESTLVAVIADAKTHEKLLYTSYLLAPKIAVLDPRMTMSLPAVMTAATGMDALTHAIEAFSCLQKNPVSDAFALSAVRLIRENLVASVKHPGEVKHRFALANAALLAGAAFSNSMVGAVHSIGHACSTVCKLPHGVAMNILLPHVMRANLPAAEKAYAELAHDLTGSCTLLRAKDRAIAAVEAVVSLRKELHAACKLPITLSEAGVARESLDEIAARAVNDGSMITNPKHMDKKCVLDILIEAYK